MLQGYCLLSMSFFTPLIRSYIMDIQIGDILEMKKEHPCGSKRWTVVRLGMDLRLRCEGCGREVILPRRKAESAVRSVKRQISSPDKNS